MRLPFPFPSPVRLAVALAALHPALAVADLLRVANAGLELGVETGRGRLVSFIDRATGRNFAGPDTAPEDGWRVDFEGAGAGASARNAVSPDQARSVRVEPAADGRPGLTWTWSDFPAPAPDALRVRVTVELEEQAPSSRWRIELDGTGGRTVERIQFPRWGALPGMERERLVMPFWGGLLAPEPRTVIGRGPEGTGRREVDYPGHSALQCLAFYAEGGPGLSIVCDDTAGHRKLFAATVRAGGDLGLEVTHLPERDPAGAPGIRLPYGVRVGTFHGDWFEAASAYRAWATNQAWARESRWRRGLVPRWVADTGLWIWNRGRSPGVLEPARLLRRESGLPVSVFWHWWHGCAYDTGFPEYLPPREGSTAFAEALRQAHAEDVHALVYMNQRLWGMTTASWTRDHAATWAVKSPDGTIRPEVYNTFSRLPCATMCLATDFWRRTYAGIGDEAFHGLGVDGIYMDQACSSLACYDPDHGHPRGGGTYWIRGFQSLAADLRRRCPERGGIALAGEGCAENWLPHLDAMLALDVSRERYVGPDGWEPIPFFHAIYHGYGVFYGSYSSLTRPPYDDLWPAATAPTNSLQLLDPRFRTQFLLEQARAFCWGQQPTLANFLPNQLQERPDEIAFVLRLARLRRLALPFLQDGALLPEPVLDVAAEDIPVSRLSIYAGQQGAVQEFRKTVPLALASAWRAPDGRPVVTLVSLADRPLTPTLTVDLRRIGEPASRRAFDLEDPQAAPEGEPRDGALVLRPRLRPREARLWILRDP